MLAKMGWKEGTGLGKTGDGITAPIAAGGHIHGAGVGDPLLSQTHIHTHTLRARFLGSAKPLDVSTEDDAFSAYKKKMALSYRFRPNPLNNPRKAYWDDPSMNSGATQKLA